MLSVLKKFTDPSSPRTKNIFSEAGAIAFGAGGSVIGQERANRAMLREGRRNRKFVRKMSNTAYRRAVRDMRKAGLNPMLAGVNQSPAFTPGMGSIPSLGNPMQGMASTAKEISFAEQNKQNIRANTYAANTQGVKNDADAVLAGNRAIREAINTRLDTLKLPKGRAEAHLYRMGGAALSATEKALPWLSGAAGVIALGRRGKNGKKTQPGQGVLTRKQWRQTRRRMRQRRRPNYAEFGDFK